MMQRYNFFRYSVIFFRAGGCAGGCAGPARGRRPRVGGARGKAGGGARPAQGRRHRGAEARTRAGHHRTAPKGRAEDGRARRAAQAAGTATAEGRAPPPACGAWERAPCVGLRVGECFTWNIFATGSLSVRYGSPHSPRLLQTYRNCPSNTLLGPWLRGYRCKHMVTDVNNQRLQM